MKRTLFLALAAALASVAAGCGDNSRQCGPGTEDVNGVCTGTDIICTDGTKLNAEGTGCEIDPNACQDGTVLVGGACVDPGHVTPTITEAAEPNGLGLLGEVSVDDAGDVAIPAVGTNFIIKGSIAPFQDLIGAIDPLTGMDVPDGQLDPDIDAYTIEVTGPVFIDMTADGLHGLAAGFVAIAVVADTDPLFNWQRFGLNLTGDTSKRNLYLPAAGTYIVGIADTRSLFLGGGAAGSTNPNLPFEYYITVTQATIAPATITVTNNVGQATGELAPGEVKFFNVALGEGVNDVTYDAPADANLESVVTANTSGGVAALKTVADGNTGFNTPAITALTGIVPGDTSLIVADHVFNYAQQPVDFELTVRTRGCVALSTAGAAVMQPATASQFQSVPGDPNSAFDDLSCFHYNVATDLEITGFDITFDRPVVGVVVDENFFIFSFFTFDPFFGFAFEETFLDYVGLMRHQTAGRYYFLTYDPTFAGGECIGGVPNGTCTAPTENANTCPQDCNGCDGGAPNGTCSATENARSCTADCGADQIVATSTYAPVVPGTITKGTPTAAQTPTVFESNPFNYMADVNTDNWQQFNAGGTASGNITLRYFNPAALNGDPGFGFGRLDDHPGNVCGNFCQDSFPLFTSVHNANGTTTVGRILLDDGTQNYLVTANTATVAGADFTLNFARRDHTDMGTVAAGASVTSDDDPIDGVGQIQRYIVKTAANNGLTITVTPTTGVDSRFQRLNNNETNRGALVNNGAVSTADSVQIFQSGEGWTAFQVTALAPVAGGQVDVAVNATAPVTYTAAASATAFADACTNGTNIVMQDPDEGASVANINTPAGFDFFGFPAPQIKVFSNGFVSVDTALVCPSVGGSCFFGNAPIPSAGNPNGILAPFWSDIVLGGAIVDDICQETIGTKLVIQWRGNIFLSPDLVSFQLIIDGADDSVEFVYDVAANHTATGTSFTTSGIENQVGGAGNQITFNTAVAAGTSVKLTKN